MWCGNDLKTHIDTFLELWHMGDKAHQPSSPLQIDSYPKSKSRRLVMDESPQSLPPASMMIRMSMLPVYPTVVFVKYVSSSFHWRPYICFNCSTSPWSFSMVVSWSLSLVNKRV
jgi:hypothetical protein